MRIIYRQLTVSSIGKSFVVILLAVFVGSLIQVLPSLFDLEFTVYVCLKCRLSRHQRLAYKRRHQQFCTRLLWSGFWGSLVLGWWSMSHFVSSDTPDLVFGWVFPQLGLPEGGPNPWAGVLGFYGSITPSPPNISFLECDEELYEIHPFIDDEAINLWYAPHQKYQPGKKGSPPIPASTRAHILFAVKRLPSFNETCEQIKSNKIYQAFCQISTISAGTLSLFRSSLTFEDLIALMKIFICKAEQLGLFEGCADLFVQDSTELESPCSWEVIDTIQRGNQTIKVYRDPTAQLGKRAKKKGKSRFFVGHRKHTLSVVRGTKVISLISVVAPADQADQYFLLPLLQLACVLGLEVRYLVADLAYIDQGRKQFALKHYGTLVMTDKKANTKLPEQTNPKTGHPQCFQGESMKWEGFDPKTGQHTYTCPLENPHQDCPRAPLCPGERTIDAKTYPIAFGMLPVHIKPVRDMLKKRKAVEPMFRRNRQKGALDNVTLMGKPKVHFLACIADICDILKTLAQLQKELPDKTDTRLFQRTQTSEPIPDSARGVWL